MKYGNLSNDLIKIRELLNSQILTKIWEIRRKDADGLHAEEARKASVRGAGNGLVEPTRLPGVLRSSAAGGRLKWCG